MAVNGYANSPRQTFNFEASFRPQFTSSNNPTHNESSIGGSGAATPTGASPAINPTIHSILMN